MSEKKRLSVLIPNYNHGKYLRCLLDSILPLEKYLYEILVCDDGSTDNSWEILSEYAQKYSLIRLLKNEKNLGAMGNFERLLKEASGDFIMMQAADDFWFPKEMQRLLEQMHNNDFACAIYCGRNIFLMENSGHQFDFPSKFPTGIFPPGSVSSFHGGFPWGGNGLWFKTEVFRRLYPQMKPLGCFYDNIMELIVAQYDHK